MFYYIVASPPGYPEHQKFMVGEYVNRDYDSYVKRMIAHDGTPFAATLEAARDMIPAPAQQRPFDPEGAFIELWEADCSKD